MGQKITFNLTMASITGITSFKYEPRSLNGNGNFMVLPPETDFLRVLKMAKKHRCRLVVKTSARGKFTGKYYLKFPEKGAIEPEEILRQFEGSDRIKRKVWFIHYE